MGAEGEAAWRAVLDHLVAGVEIADGPPGPHAIGNIAVVVAGGLVWLTSMAWPDLLAAAVVAGLFLQSPWSIVRDALKNV
jgi:hypothetical protein